MELAISKLTARRVIYYFEGYVKGERPKGLKFVFYNYDLKITIKHPYLSGMGIPSV